jgi:DNA-binding LytR/AlgR family response regulator
MPSIAVVDDDPRCREAIAAAARAHIFAWGEECRVAEFADAASFLTVAAAQAFDIAVLDIIMPEKSGLDAALELYERDQGCRIIFLTVSPEYAIHGYRVNALDYLLKPVDPAALGRALDRSLDRNASAPAFTLMLRQGRELKKINASDILYCRSEGNNVHFYGTGWTIGSRGKVDEFKARLPGSFVQTHNRYLVNLARAVAMSTQAVRLDNGDAAPISRAFKDSVAAAYFDHVSGEADKA